MTAIVTDGTAMAADGLTSTTNDMINDNTIKLHRLPDGSIIGAAGAADRWPEAVAELSRSIEADDLPAEMKGDYDLLRLLPNGKVVGYHERLRPHAVAVPAAIGSGGDYARAAVLAGADLKTAIKIAGQIDLHTGGRTRIVSLDRRNSSR